MTELEEEQGGEEGAFSELDKVNKANVTARLKEIKGNREAKDEAAVLNDWLKLANEEASLKKRLKDAESLLDSKPIITIPNSPRMILRHWWWMTNGSHHWIPLSTVRWTGSASHSPSA